MRIGSVRNWIVLEGVIHLSEEYRRAGIPAVQVRLQTANEQNGKTDVKPNYNATDVPLKNRETQSPAIQGKKFEKSIGHIPFFVLPLVPSHTSRRKLRSIYHVHPQGSDSQMSTGVRRLRWTPSKRECLHCGLVFHGETCTQNTFPSNFQILFSRRNCFEFTFPCDICFSFYAPKKHVYPIEKSGLAHRRKWVSPQKKSGLSHRKNVNHGFFCIEILKLDPGIRRGMGIFLVIRGNLSFQIGMGPFRKEKLIVLDGEINFSEFWNLKCYFELCRARRQGICGAENFCAAPEFRLFFSVCFSESPQAIDKSIIRCIKTKRFLHHVSQKEKSLKIALDNQISNGKFSIFKYQMENSQFSNIKWKILNFQISNGKFSIFKYQMENSQFSNINFKNRWFSDVNWKIFDF